VRGSISNASHLSQSITLHSLRAATFAAEKDEKYRIMQERAEEVKRVLANDKYTGMHGTSIPSTPAISCA
jgi:hypothetical protein